MISLCTVSEIHTYKKLNTSLYGISSIRYKIVFDSNLIIIFIFVVRIKMSLSYTQYHLGVGNFQQFCYCGYVMWKLTHQNRWKLPSIAYLSNWLIPMYKI